MTGSKTRSIGSLAVSLLVTIPSTVVCAQAIKVEGLIKGGSGDEMTLKTSDNPELVVVLTDSTDVAQLQGMFKARNKKMSMAALVPGLAVTIEGTSNDKNQLVKIQGQRSGKCREDPGRHA